MTARIYASLVLIWTMSAICIIGVRQVYGAVWAGLRSGLRGVWKSERESAKG